MGAGVPPYMRSYLEAQLGDDFSSLRHVHVAVITWVHFLALLSLASIFLPALSFVSHPLFDLQASMPGLPESPSDATLALRASRHHGHSVTRPQTNAISLRR